MALGLNPLSKEASNWLDEILWRGHTGGDAEVAPKASLRKAAKLLFPIRKEQWNLAHPGYGASEAQRIHAGRATGIWFGLDHGLYGIAFGRVPMPEPYGWDPIPTSWRAETREREADGIRMQVEGLREGLDQARLVAASVGQMLSIPPSIEVPNPVTRVTWTVPLRESFDRIPDGALDGWFPSSEWAEWRKNNQH